MSYGLISGRRRMGEQMKIKKILLPVDAVDFPLFSRVAQMAGTSTAAAFYAWCAVLAATLKTETPTCIKGLNLSDFDQTGGLEAGTTQRVVDALKAVGRIKNDTFNFDENDFEEEA